MKASLKLNAKPKNDKQMKRTIQKRREYIPSCLKKRKPGDRYEGWSLGFKGFDGTFQVMKGPFATESQALEMVAKNNYLIRHMYPDASTTFEWIWKNHRWNEILKNEANKLSQQASTGFHRTN